MFKVYILYSEIFNKIYIGFTSNIEQRILSHNILAQKGWTIKYRPWKLIHIEDFGSKTEAIKRESNLKSGVGREWIRSTLFKDS